MCTYHTLPNLYFRSTKRDLRYVILRIMIYDIVIVNYLCAELLLKSVIMNKGGKPRHSFWIEGAFIEKRNEKGKLIAKCKVCNKILQNTAINRLKDHRLVLFNYLLYTYK